MCVALLVVACDAFHVPAMPRSARSLRSYSTLIKAQDSVPEGSPVPEDSAVPETQPKPKSTGAGVMPEKFMGVFDMSSGIGSLGASLTVSVMFCTVVELIKALDPNPDVVSEWFGKF